MIEFFLFVSLLAFLVSLVWATSEESLGGILLSSILVVVSLLNAFLWAVKYIKQS